MDSYEDFAYIYDRLMNQDMNYGHWADYIENLFHYYGKNPNLVADLACGTGNITLPLSRRGYEMIGVDVSEHMLSVAREKAQRQKQDILFLQQDLSKLDLFGTVDAFLCMIDGINYMVSPEKLERLFRRIKTCFLEPGGIFLFDISSRYKLEEVIGNNTFVHSGEDVFYTWENRYVSRHHLSSMYLTFFQQEKGGLYRRFEESHLQRAHGVGELKNALLRAGFQRVDTYGELSFSAPGKEEQRIVFAAL